MKPVGVAEIMLLPADHLPDTCLDLSSFGIEVGVGWRRAQAMFEVISSCKPAASESTVVADLQHLVDQDRGGGVRKALSAMTKSLGGRPRKDDAAAIAEVVDLMQRDRALSISKACYIVAGTMQGEQSRKSAAARLAKHMRDMKKCQTKLLK